MATRAKYEITAEDKTRAGIDSAKKNFKELSESALNLKGVFAGALGAISAGAIASSFKSVLDGADSMGKLSQATGVAVEQLSGLNYAAKLSDVDTNTLGNSLKKLAKNAVDTANGTGEAKDAFAALGISVKDSSGKMRGTGELFGQLSDKFAGLEDGTEKTALAMQVFGKSGAQLIPLLNEGSAGLARASKEAELFGLIISEELSDNAQALNDNLTRLSSAVQGSMIQAFSATVPVVGELSEMMVEFVKDTEAVKSAGEAANTGLKLLVNGGIIVKSVFQQLGTLIGGVAAAFVQFFHGVANFDLDEIKASGETLKNVYADVTDNASRDIERMAKVWNAAGVAAKEAGDDAKAGGNATKTVLNDVSKAGKNAQKELEALAKKRREGAKTINEQIKALRDEQVALALGEREREIYVALLKAEETARNAGIVMTDKQREAIIRETGAIYDQREAIDARKKAEEKAAKEREALAKENAEAMRRPFEHAAEGIQDAFTDAFAEIYNGNVDSFSDLAKQIKSVFVRLAAEITTLMVFNPKASFGSLLGGVGLFGSGTAAASTGAQLAGSGDSGMNLLSIGSAAKDFILGPAGPLVGIGALGGYGISRLTGGDPLGSSLGGAAGAYAGVLAGSGVLGGATGALVGIMGQLGNFVIPGLGLVLGALAGGSLFGSKQPSNESAFGKINLGTGQQLQAPAERNSNEQTREARDQLVEAILLLREGVVSATGGTLRGNIDLDVGQRDGVYVGGLGLNRAYSDPEAALGAVFRGMLNNLQGVDAELREVFARIDTSDLEKAVADLGAAASIINREYIAAEPLSAAQQAIKSIRDNFDPIVQKARELGLAVAPIRAEQNRQLVQLRRDFNAEIRDQILAITDPLQAALNAFDDVAAERLANARELGASIVTVERLNALERAKIVEQYGQVANDSLSQLISSLGRTGLTPAATVMSLGSEFSDLFEAANRPGANLDDIAVQAINLAPQLVNAGQQAYASGPQFQQLLATVTELLTQLQARQNGSTTTIKIVTVDGRTITENTIEEILTRSANGEIVVNSRGVA